MNATWKHPALLLLVLVAGCGRDQIQRNEPTKLRLATHNYAFRQEHHNAERLFNGFDYGHSMISHAFMTGAPIEDVEGKLFTRIMRINDHPPRLMPAEEAISPHFARAHWRVQNLFDWTHGLHRQINDILSDDSIGDKHAAIEEATDYYLQQPMAVHWQWKRMDILMDGQPYSGEFKKSAPKWNGLIWAYHWYQNGVYEPMMLGRTRSERAIGVEAAAALYHCSRVSVPDRFPTHMPMSWEVAPTFAEMHPRAAAIFDNLHMLHDITSDVLLSDKVKDKEAELNRMVDLLQDSTSYIDDSGNRGMGPDMKKMDMEMEKEPGVSSGESNEDKHAVSGSEHEGQGDTKQKNLDMFRGGPGASCADGLRMNPVAYVPVEAP